MFFKHALVQTKWLLYKWLNRRSQKRSYTSDTFFNGLLRTFPLLELQGSETKPQHTFFFFTYLLNDSKLTTLQY